MLTFRFDYAAKGRGIGATPIETTPEGYKVYRGVAAFGDVVLEYPEDGVNELAPAADVMGPGIAESIIARPFTILHPDDLLDAEDPETIQSKTVGTVRAARANMESTPPQLEVEVVVWTRPAQDDIESGRVVELSPGYQRDPEKAPQGAALGGKPYHIVQRRRRYNHLSGVISARGVTPDGRRARLDEASAATGMTPDEWRSFVAEQFAGGNPAIAEEATRKFIDAMQRIDASAAYAPVSMDDLIIADPAPTDETTARTDADAPPPAPMDAPVPPAGAEGAEAEAEEGAEEIEVAAEDPAAGALAGFSSEDAEVLKQLSPEGLAALMMALKQQKAEAAEQAVMAAPAGAPVEVEMDAPPAPAAAAPASAAPEAPADATAPMAPQGLTADAVAQMIDAAMAKSIDAFKAIMAESKKAAPPAAGDGYDAGKKDAAPAVATATATAKVDAAAVAREIAERRRMDAAFVEHARKDGHLGESEAATVKAAATKMLAVITEHLPDLVPMAKDALKDPKRRDGDFVSIYQAAEKKRRDALLDDQQAPFGAFASESGYDAATTSIIDSLIS